MLSAQAANYMPCLRSDSLADKLRFAASRGQVDYVRQLLASGIASFESDAVSCTLTVHIHISCVFLSETRVANSANSLASCKRIPGIITYFTLNKIQKSCHCGYRH